MYDCLLLASSLKFHCSLIYPPDALFVFSILIWVFKRNRERILLFLANWLIQREERRQWKHNIAKKQPRFLLFVLWSPRSYNSICAHDWKSKRRLYQGPRKVLFLSTLVPFRQHFSEKHAFMGGLRATDRITECFVSSKTGLVSEVVRTCLQNFHLMKFATWLIS